MEDFGVCDGDRSGESVLDGGLLSSGALVPAPQVTRGPGVSRCRAQYAGRTCEMQNQRFTQEVNGPLRAAMTFTVLNGGQVSRGSDSGVECDSRDFRGTI